MNVGDNVLYDGRVYTILRVVRPRCRCKGNGHYELQSQEDGYVIKVPIETNLEPYKPLTMANQILEPHKF